MSEREQIRRDASDAIYESTPDSLTYRLGNHVADLLAELEALRDARREIGNRVIGNELRDLADMFKAVDTAIFKGGQP